jgi:hypothetical protein
MRTAVCLIALLVFVSPAAADPLTCSLAEYRQSPGLTAAVAGDVLDVTWDGDAGQQVRLRLAVVGGVPMIQELAVRARGDWQIVASGVTPEYRVVTGMRRVTEQQLQPLRQLKVELTQTLIDDIKWDAFWDAPLNVEPIENTRTGAIPPLKGIGSQPGLPRKPEEIARAEARYALRGCAVKTNGARLEIAFDGVQLGVFDGRAVHGLPRIESDRAGSHREDRA